MRASIAVSQRVKTIMGYKDGDPTPARKTLLAYIAEHGPLIAHELHACEVGYTHRLHWLAKEGYVQREKSGGRAGDLWSITPLGSRWIAPVHGDVAPPRTIAFTGCVTESRDLVWPDVASGRMRAFELQSRGME